MQNYRESFSFRRIQADCPFPWPMVVTYLDQTSLFSPLPLCHDGWQRENAILTCTGTGRLNVSPLAPGQALAAPRAAWICTCCLAYLSRLQWSKLGQCVLETEVWMRPNGCIHNPPHSMSCPAHETALPPPSPVPFCPPPVFPPPRKAWAGQTWLAQGRFYLHPSLAQQGLCSCLHQPWTTSAGAKRFTACSWERWANASGLHRSKEGVWIALWDRLSCVQFSTTE